MIHFLAAAWDGTEGEANPGASQWTAWLPVVVASFVLPLAAARGTSWTESNLPGELAPLLAGGLIALAAGRFFLGRGTAAPALPAGDLLAPLEAVARRLHSLWERKVGPPLRDGRNAIYAYRWHEPHEIPVLRSMLDLGESWWGSWPVCGFLFLLALIVTAVVLLPELASLHCSRAVRRRDAGAAHRCSTNALPARVRFIGKTLKPRFIPDKKIIGRSRGGKSKMASPGSLDWNRIEDWLCGLSRLSHDLAEKRQKPQK